MTEKVCENCHAVDILNYCEECGRSVCSDCWYGLDETVDCPVCQDCIEVSDRIRRPEEKSDD